MAPSPLTPINEESLPNFAEIKVQRENNNVPSNSNNKSPSSNNLAPEDRGCLFFYDSPEVKGPFFDDSFFKDAQRNYEEAIQSILSRNHSVLQDTGDSNMSTYRNLRQENGRQETQASGLTEQDDKYQIVLDVHSYAPTDITIKAVGDQELLVEGKHVERRADGSALNQRSFSRRFFLPGLVKLDAVTSALSSDGVLTVTAPKMAKQIGSVVSDKTQFGMGPSPAPGQTVNGVRSSKFNEKENCYNEELGQFLSDLDLESRMKYQLGFENKMKNSTDSTTGVKKQVGDIVEEDQHYKVALDTTGYSPNDISVKAVGERELLIEGRRVEKNEAGGEKTQSFSRRFCLPGPVQLQAVTSSLSLDGTLTIRAPKLAPQITSSASDQTSTNGRRLSQQQTPQNVLNNQTRTAETVSSNFSNVQDNKENDAQFYGNSIDDFFSKDFVGSHNVNNFRNSNSFMEKARTDYQESLRNMMNRNWIVETDAPSFFTDPSSIRTVENNSQQRATSDIIESADDYKMKLDVSQYRPEDISVKAVGDRELQIEGRHVEKNASGPSISHSFSRRFSLPGPVRMETVKSSLSPEGVLTVTAPKLAVTSQ